MDFNYEQVRVPVCVSAIQRMAENMGYTVKRKFIRDKQQGALAPIGILVMRKGAQAVVVTVKVTKKEVVYTIKSDRGYTTYSKRDLAQGVSQIKGMII